MTPARKTARRFHNPFKPPFPGLIAIMLGYFFLSFFVHPNSSIRQGVVTDPDANMYLVEALDLVDGQGWYDRVEHRLDPPAGVTMHFSRLAELPYAAVIAPLQPILGRVPAALIAAIVWPPVFMLGFMLVMRQQARCFMPRAWAGLTALTTIFALDLAFEFIPGRAGHRGLVPLLVALAVMLLSQFVLRAAMWRRAAAAGAALAFALSFSMEALPWILVLAAALGFWATVKGGEERAKGGLAFGSSLALAGMLLLALHYPPAQLFIAAPLYMFSWIYVVLLFGIAACFAMVWIVRHRSPYQRLGIAAVTALLVGSAFVMSHPRVLAGPYGEVDSKLMKLMLLNIAEAVPLYMRIRLVPLILGSALWPLLSIAVCLWQIKYSSPRRRWLWGGFALLQTTGFALAFFYQSRCIDYMQMFGIMPLTVLMYHGLRDHVNSRPVGLMARRALTLAVLPLLVLAPGALFNGMSPIDLALFPMQTPMEPCRDIRATAAVLNSAPYNEGRPKLLINSMAEGPALLLLTRDNILAAPYPEDVTGNVDVFNFFRAADSGVAEHIAYERRADFVATCRYVETGYLVPRGQETSFYKLGYIDVPSPVPMAFRFMRSWWPNWLTPVTSGTLGDMMLLRVEPAGGFSAPAPQ
jgi:hypothetical protein